MRKLFLTSGGIRPELKEDFIKFIGKDPKGLKVAFIPTAADPEKDKTFVQWTINQISDLGLESTTVDLKEETEKSLLTKLKLVDIILVNGGNTFYLLDYVRKSGFEKIIGKLLDDGKIYVGISAGSYIACPTIEAAHWKHADRDVVGLKDLSALKFVPFLISAHFDEKWRQTVNTIKTNYPFVALYDTQAVEVIGDKYRVVGTGPREFFNGFKENL